ncbi:tyrosine-type recombinase/integrase [Marinomonas atlantica]|uniref:tyrosine-type recombinase/integrase n=1 Tax=Marinomonas atlantica TaxID=1806668 RepID=UPI00082FD64C|nr:tyrosine-type recombinase/integrase [Marinomonas atlantica]
MTSKRITDTLIKATLATGDKEWLFDSRRVEFRANQSRTGGTFYDVRYQGKRKVRTVLGKWPALRASDLFKRLSAIRSQTMAGERSTVKVEQIKDVQGLLLWFADHIESDKSFSDSYAATAHGCIYNHLMDSLGDVAIKSLSKTDFYKRVYMPKQETLAVSTLHKVWGVLKRACSLAGKLGLIARDPLMGVGWRDFTQDKEVARSGRLKPYQLPELAQCIQDSQFWRRLFFSMQLCHATRILETSLVEWSHISLDDAVWYIPAANTKTGIEHKVPIAPAVVELLREASAKRRGKFVFSQNGKKSVHTSTASKWYQKLSAEFGQKFTSHDMRKLARDYWQESGVDSRVAEMLLNHAQSDLEGRYQSRYAWPEMVKAVGALAGVVFGQ